MSIWFKSHERRDFDRAQDFLDSSRIVMNSAIETTRSINELNVYNHEQLSELITTVFLNAHFLNKNLDAAIQKFSAWEEALRTSHPERFIKVRRMSTNVRKNFDVASTHSVVINQWIEDNMVTASLY
jgi:hypothetical protein